MKQQFVILFSVLLVVVSSQQILKVSPQQVQEGLKAFAKCTAETNFQLDALKTLIKIDENFEPSEDGKQFIFCIGRELNVANDDGSANVSKMFETVIDPEMRKIIEKCVPEGSGKATPAENSYGFTKCAVKTGLGL